LPGSCPTERIRRPAGPLPWAVGRLDDDLIAMARPLAPPHAKRLPRVQMGSPACKGARPRAEGLSRLQRGSPPLAKGLPRVAKGLPRMWEARTRRGGRCACT
jgi:hypothetical protein